MQSDVTDRLNRHIRQLTGGFPRVQLRLCVTRGEHEPERFFAVYGDATNACFPEVIDHFNDLVVVVCRCMFLPDTSYSWSVAAECDGRCDDAWPLG